MRVIESIFAGWNRIVLQFRRISPDNGRAHGMEAAVVLEACVASKRPPVWRESGDAIHKGFFRIGHDHLNGFTKGP
jgi:hypothetical protein